MDYVSLPPKQREPRLERYSQLLDSIANLARLGGNVELLMELDRFPGLMLGPSNQVPEGAMEAAFTKAVAALDRLQDRIKAAKAAAQS
jgi:hypothetical protein